MSSHILNCVEKINNYSYLELGVCDNSNFNLINAGQKDSVDINGKAIYNCTTDEFFANNKKRYDIIYIDANHDFDFVLRDFNNSIDVCNKAILIHDMIPPTKMHTESRYCSDSFKLLKYLIENNYNVISLNEDFGLTIVLPEFKKASPGKEIRNLSYEDFVNFLNNKKLHSFTEASEVIKGL